jgi:hypothetical protein
LPDSFLGKPEAVMDSIQFQVTATALVLVTVI